MPIALYPELRVRLTLKIDEQRAPEAERPTFIFKNLSGRQWMDLVGLEEQVKDAAKARLGHLYDALRVGLVGWENMRSPDGAVIPYDPAKLEDLINLGEARELLEALGKSMMPTPAEGNGSGSPSA